MVKTAKNKFGLTERDMATLQRIFKKYPEIKKIHIFGSRAKGNYKQGSDIDLAVMNKGVSPKTITALLSDYEESSLPYMVDLVYLPDLTHKDLIKHIERVGRSFYKK